jgi:hypothetical protein
MSFCGFDWDSENWLLRMMLLRLLAKIVPFITSIDSIIFLQINLFKMVYNKNNNSNPGNSHESLLQWMWKMICINNNNKTKLQLLLKEMMVKTRILVIDWLVVIIIHALLSNLLMIFLF